MTDDTTEAEKALTRLLGMLDGSGGVYAALLATLRAASDAGHPVESSVSKATDADRLLTLAFEEADSENPDPEKLRKLTTSAADRADAAYKALPDSAEEYHPPSYADTGVYDTLGAYADYVRTNAGLIRETARDYERLRG